MLQNLLSNALRYTREGRVLLGARRRPQGLELQVLDTGGGIPESEQVRIFEEFERLSNPVEADGEGLGLGLAIVKRYSEMLELPLSLRSEPGRGSVFAFIVPYGETRDSAQPDQPVTIDGELSGYRVLCLDNEPVMRESLLQVLGSLGCVVTAVADRSQLAQALDGGPLPDVVLADYHLDEGDNGIDAVRALFGARGLRIPVVMLSADDSPETRDRARAAGFRFLPKPVSAERLKALLVALRNAG